MSLERPKNYTPEEIMKMEEIRKRVAGLDDGDTDYKSVVHEVAKEEDKIREKYKSRLSVEDINALGDEKSTDVLKILETQKRLTEAEEKNLTDSLTGLGNYEKLKMISESVFGSKRVEPQREKESIHS